MAFDTDARRHVKVAFDRLADRLVEDLAAAAQAEADAAAAQARAEAAAEAAEAREEAAAAVARARADAEAAAAAAAQQARQEAEAAAAAAVARARQDGEASAAAAADRVRQEAEVSAAAALAAARAEGEARLAAAQAMNAGLLQSVEAARDDVRSLEQRLDQAQQERGQLQATHQDAVKRLDAEAERARETGGSLEIATRQVRELTQAVQRIRQHRDAMVDRVGAALSAIDHATSPSEILETLLEPLAEDFAVAAVFLVSPASLNGWRDIGLGPATDVTRLVIMRDTESLLNRAAAERTRLFVAATASAPLVGLLGHPVARIAALPILAGPQVVAIAYGEDPHHSDAPLPGAGGRIAAMLIDHANLRLTIKRPNSFTPPAPVPSPYSTARQAPRLKTGEGFDLTVDGAESSIVDVSSIGAQILSAVAMKPNRTLRMTLRAGQQELACKARVVWARFEQPRGMTAAQYRVGVKFTELERPVMDAFLARYGVPQQLSQ